MNPMTIDGQGRLQLPAQVLRDLARESLRPISRSDRHLLLGAEGQGDLVLAGSLGDITVADLLSFLNMFRKTGILRFRLSGGTRTLYLENGEIVYAASTFPDEDLGETLCEQGKIDREQLQKLRQTVPGRALGRLLVERELLGAKELWLATRQQVEEIVYRLFACEEGSFAFFAQPLDSEEIVRLSMSTQNLIMEGLRRLDERTQFLRRIGSLDLRVVPRDAGEGELGEAARRVMAVAADGRCDVRTLMRRSGLGEFETLRQLYQLLGMGVVALEEPPAAAPDGPLGDLLTIYNGALAALHRRVAAAHPEFSQEIRVFLRDLPPPFSYVLRDVSLREDGTVDGGRVAANLDGLGPSDQVRLLADALNELVFMECMAARRELGGAESAGLIRRVQELTGRVKNLVGRT